MMNVLNINGMLDIVPCEICGEQRDNHTEPHMWTPNVGIISDGYHTFDELYEHRIRLWITLCQVIDSPDIWRSRLHSDGSEFSGWFVMGIGKAKGTQITYHLPEAKWDECAFAETLERAPEYDGHTSEDVLKRLRRLWL